MASKATKDSFDPREFLAKLGTGKTISKYRKDQIVFAQGEKADTVFYLQKGRIKVVVLSDQGKEAVVGMLEPGQFFGEGCLNGHQLRIATTTAMEECLITAITKPAMIAVLHDEPKFSEMFVAYLLTRNSRIEEDLIDQLFNSSEKRLARLLLLLANFGKEGTPLPISPRCLSCSKITIQESLGIPLHHSDWMRSRVKPPTPAMVMGTKQKNPKKYSHPVRKPGLCPSVRLV